MTQSGWWDDRYLDIAALKDYVENVPAANVQDDDDNKEQFQDEEEASSPPTSPMREKVAPLIPNRSRSSMI